MYFTYSMLESLIYQGNKLSIVVIKQVSMTTCGLNI